MDALRKRRILGRLVFLYSELISSFTFKCKHCLNRFESKKSNIVHCRQLSSPGGVWRRMRKVPLSLCLPKEERVGNNTFGVLTQSPRIADRRPSKMAVDSCHVAFVIMRTLPDRVGMLKPSCFMTAFLTIVLFAVPSAIERNYFNPLSFLKSKVGFAWFSHQSTRYSKPFSKMESQFKIASEVPDLWR